MTPDPEARQGPAAAVVPLEKLRAHPRNVRVSLGDLRDLADSIREQGLLVPVMAERRGDHLRLLHGHRRVAAAKQAGLRRVPCVVVDEMAPEDAIALMLVENDQRLGLTPAEKRTAVLSLRDEFEWPMARIAKRLGVSAATAYRLARGEEDLNLTPTVQERKPKAPSIKATEVHDLTARWTGRAPEPLLRELRALLKGWQPAPTPEERV